MDVFLEECPSADLKSVLSRVALAKPLRASSLDELITEATALCRNDIRYVAVRRQQVHRIGEHSIREVLDDHGISVSCLGFAGGFTGALGQSYSRAVEDVHRAIEVADQLAARAVIVVPGNRGMHTHRHAERIVRDGLRHSAMIAGRAGIRLFVPTDTVLADTRVRDCFQPAECLMNWLGNVGDVNIRPMIVVRGGDGYRRLPAGWREHLARGGCLRICHRCESYNQNTQVLQGILEYLFRRSDSDKFE